jgi:phosphoribosylformylglycinamidine cyclo-ligase
MTSPTDPKGPPPTRTYKDAGVDVEAKSALLDGLARAVRSTYTPAVAAGVGAFAGALRLDDGSVFVLATTDGAGTKTLLARRLNRDSVIGADIVAHCANDLVASGGRPLAFLDYIAMGRLVPTVVNSLVEAMAAACRDLGAALLGGETAEMPDIYAGEAYDVVGTMIGTAPSDGLITGKAVRPGDRMIGLASTGLHTNGYSLARRVVDAAGASLQEYVPEIGTAIGEALLQPHRCYAPAVLSLLTQTRVRAVAHITGGGIPDNLVRVLPDGCRARVIRTWPEPPIFEWLQRAGRIPADEMARAFNLGIGMILVVGAHEVSQVIGHFGRAGIRAFDVGEILPGPRGVELI